MRFLTFLLLFSYISLSAQIRPLIYFSQVSFGSSSYHEVGDGIIRTGDINGDSIADIAIGGRSTFQVGYARIDNGVLHLDMQAIDYLEEVSLFRGHLIDVDSDGDIDFTVKKSVGSPPSVITNYTFENKGGTIQELPVGPPPIFPHDVILKFGRYNNDAIADAQYRLGDEQVIMDGVTGQIYKPFSSSLPPETTGSAHRIDLNGDGLLDFLMHVDNFPGSDTIVHETYINQGDFAFTIYGTRGFLRAGDHGDFDGDGVLDIIGSIGDGDSLHYRIKSNLVSADDAVFFDLNLNGHAYDPSPFPYDLNQDGYDDLVVFTDDTIYYCKNNQDYTFEVFEFPQINPVRLRLASHPSWPVGTIISEHGDAVPVLYQLNFDGTNFTVEKSSATISPPVIPDPPTHLRMTTFDVDSDGHKELAIGSGFEVLAAELENNAFQEYTAHLFDNTDFPFLSSMASADFNKDGLQDFVFSLPHEPDLLQISFGESDSTFSPATTLATKYDLCFKIGVGDFDGNGFIDFAASGGIGDNGRFSIFLNQNGTQFIEKQILDARHETWRIIDPNADGIADLAITTNFTKIYMNDGQANLDSTQIIYEGLAKSNKTDTPYLFTTRGKLIKIDSDGMGNSVIGSTDILVNTRTAYTLDYNLDGLPDLLYSEEGGVFNHVDTTFLILADTVNTWEIRAFPDRYVQGVADIDGDGTEDVLWQIGSQLWVELIDTSIWSSIVEQAEVEPLRIFPNPATDVLYFGGEDWPATYDTYSIQVYNASGQLVFSKKQNENSIAIGDLERGSYFLLLRNAYGEMFGGSFIRL